MTFIVWLNLFTLGNKIELFLLVERNHVFNHIRRLGFPIILIWFLYIFKIVIWVVCTLWLWHVMLLNYYLRDIVIADLHKLHRKLINLNLLHIRNVVILLRIHLKMLIWATWKAIIIIYYLLFWVINIIICNINTIDIIYVLRWIHIILIPWQWPLISFQLKWICRYLTLKWSL